MSPAPAEYPSAMPYFILRDGPRFIDFLRRAFLGEQTLHITDAEGYISHAEIQIGDSFIAFSESLERADLTRSAAILHVDDVDATYWRAMEAGANSLQSPEHVDGVRHAEVIDWWGNRWRIAPRTAP